MPQTDKDNILKPYKKWDQKQRNTWLEKQQIQRSYQDDVISRIKLLSPYFDIKQYGTLSFSPDKYPLYLLKSGNWDHKKKNILITGGVHGYETSGVHGALHFLETEAINYADKFNIVVAPCISPWGYETINRWNPHCIDPNRSFIKDSPSEEADLFMNAINSMNIDFMAHIDLHETTDTDNTEFLPALAARDGIDIEIWDIPDGFYLVGDVENPADEFQAAIIKSVAEVTHIAPPDQQGNIIGVELAQHGVINYATKKLGLCSGLTNSHFATTTEVYPDSPTVTDDDCIKAQVAAVKGALGYLSS